MAALHNHWQVFDTSEPVLAWQAGLPSSSPADELLPALLAALAPVVVVAAADLAHSAAGTIEPTTTLRSPVTVRDERGALVDVVANDAGQLLRRLEGPGLDPGYARRFAAVGLPFVVVTSHTDQTGQTPPSLTLTVSFFSTIWFDDRDPALLARNQARLQAARDALTAVVRRHGGRLQAPLAPR